jgi:hypothetical protein
MLKPYRFKKPRPPARPEAGARVVAEVEQENLTGLVQGQPASRDEELFARAFDYYKIAYDFQQSFVSGRNLPGEIRPDFMVYAGRPTPFYPDNQQWHGTASQKEDAKQKDAMLAAHLGAGYNYPVRIPTPADERELTQAWVKQKVKEFFV